MDAGTSGRVEASGCGQDVLSWRCFHVWDRRHVSFALRYSRRTTEDCNILVQKPTDPAASLGVLAIRTRLFNLLPKGMGLSEPIWKVRHQRFLLVLWGHVVAFPLLAWFFERTALEALIPASLVATFACAAALPNGSRRVRSVLVSIGLATASSFIVHLSGGYIEFHFHYFVMATLLVLYHDWAPLLTLVGFAAVEHGLIGGVNPHSVYNHPAALAAPWKWAALHALYIAAACVGSIVAWRKSEQDVQELQRANNRLEPEVERRTMAEQHLQQAHDELELKVHQRTEELEKANEALVLEMGQRKFAETALRQAVERYERQGRLFEGVVSTTPDFVYLFDVQGGLLYANRRLLEVSGMQLPDVIGKTCRELGCEQWHHDMHMREITQVIETKRLIKGEVSYKAPLTGVFGIYEYIFTPVLGPDGNVEFIAGTSRDITDRKRTENEIRHLLDQAQRREQELREKQEQLVQAAKMASLGEMASGIAHELNNPLNNIGLIVGNVIHRLRQASLDAAIEHSLMLVEHEITKAATIINHLRTFARKATPVRESVAVNEVVQQAVRLLQRQLAVANIHLESSYAVDDLVVFGNALQLEQVVVNLVTNARDAVQQTEAKSISVWTAREDGEAVIAVKDTGEGIAPATAPRIFDPFFTTKDVGKGTGLGLSISYQILKDMGGSISIDSQTGAGSTFTIRLPLAHCPATEPDADSPEEVPPPPLGGTIPHVNY